MAIETVALDWETYYDKAYSLKKMGTREYVNDERFDPYLLSVCTKDYVWAGRPEDFNRWDLVEGQRVISHNYGFDGLVWRRAKELGIVPEVEAGEEACTADLAVYFRGPRYLKGAVEHLLGMHISKAYRGTALAKTADDFTPEEWKEIVNAGMADAVGCYKLWEKFGDRWPLLEQRVSRINREIGWKGTPIDSKLVDEYLDHAQELLFDAEKDIPWDWSGRKTPLSPKAIAEQCRIDGIPFPSSLAQDSEECAEWENTYADACPWVKTVRTWRKLNIYAGKLKTLKSRTIKKKPDVFPFSIMYMY